MAALDHRRDRVLHVVAQIVEAEFVVRAVGDVAGVSGLALLVREPVHDTADGEPEEFIDLPHPLRVAAGEVVVDGDHVDAEARQRIQIDGEGGDKRLAFTGPHLGDVAAVQDHAAHELDVEMALAEGPLRRFPNGRKGLGQDVVEVFAAARRALKASVMARSSSSDLVLNWSSSALISSTRLKKPRNFRSLDEPKNRCAIPLKPSI